MPRATHNAAADGWNRAGAGHGTGTRSARRGRGYGPTIDTIWTRCLCKLRIAARLAAGELTEIINTPAQKYERKGGKRELLRPGLIDAVSVD
jgi:hypothetical protein